jgi:hypothetical protein
MAETSEVMKEAKALSVAEAFLGAATAGWEGVSSCGQMEAEWCRISHRVHRIEFRQIVRDAEIAYAISPVVRRHRLSAEETEKFLLELRISRAANVAEITHRLVVNGSQKASSELAAQS